MAEEQKQHRFTRGESDVIIDCLIKHDMVPALTIQELGIVANDPDDERREDAQSVLYWIEQSEQQLKYRVIYDFKRNNYKRILRRILEDKGIPRLVRIISKDGLGTDKAALAAFEMLNDIVKGKPKQKIEMTGFVTHEAVQKAVEQTTLPKQANGVWVNPEDELDAQVAEQSEE